MTKMTMFLVMAMFFLGVDVMKGSSREDRINNDLVTLSLLSAVERQYDVTCKKLTEGKVQWRCLNSKKCSYTASLICFSVESLENVKVTITGMDDGSTHRVSDVKIRIVRYYDDFQDEILE